MPLGLRAWLAGLGITDVVELDWWESRTERGLTLTSVPVQHWTSRSFFEQNDRLWSGWAVAGRERRLFFAGDTGYWPPYFQAIGARLGPFDVAAVADRRLHAGGDHALHPHDARGIAADLR